MRLNPLNSKSHVPVHVQLREQLKHLILGGELGVGDKLPSIRALAGYMRINRNTVAHVVTELERGGYVETRRGSGVYVTEPPVDAEDLKRQRFLERVIEEAVSDGVSLEDLGYELLARAGTVSAPQAKIALVECNRPQVEQYSAELEERLPVEVEGLLVGELEELVSSGTELPWRLVATTFFHAAEVEALLEPRGVETFALMVEATVETLRRLVELPAATKVGLVGNSPACADNLLRSLEGAGLRHLEFLVVYDYDDTRGLRETLEEVRVVVCGSVMARKLSELGVSPETEIIAEDRTLVEGGVEMLGRMLRD